MPPSQTTTPLVSLGKNWTDLPRSHSRSFANWARSWRALSCRQTRIATRVSAKLPEAAQR